MTAESTRRSVTLERVSASRFVATNVRGGTLDIGGGEDETFTPVELLLAAIAGCSGMDVDILTSRRSEPTRFELSVRADKVRVAEGNQLENVVLSFRVSFPDDAGGDAARAVLPDAVQRSHDRLCVVSRTIERATPVAVEVLD